MIPTIPFLYLEVLLESGEAEADNDHVSHISVWFVSFYILITGNTTNALPTCW